jgi:hypothetical protein
MGPENACYLWIWLSDSFNCCVNNAIYYVSFLLIRKKPLFNREISPQNDGLRLNLVIGTIIYGIGLGLGGLNPITVLLQLPL